MNQTSGANRDQATLWNGTAGQTWSELQQLLDTQMAPFAKLLIERAIRPDTHRVLDVGCGAGATTLAAAQRVGANGSCLGVDISAPLIDLARKRASETKANTVSFLCADAQTHAFEPNQFDAVISRFGVMFFDDPVAAFRNIRRAVRSGGTLTFISWRSPAENPFMTTATRAAAPFLPDLPKPDPNAPGQFGFADPERVRKILSESGWQGIDHQPIDTQLAVAEKDLMTYVTRMGPVGLALRDVGEDTRSRTIAALREAFAQYVRDGAARFTTACWLVTANA